MSFIAFTIMLSAARAWTIILLSIGAGTAVASESSNHERDWAVSS